MANKDLLPPDDGLLLPADDSSASVTSAGGKSDDMFDQMSAKVAAGAKVLGAKATEIAAEQGPVLREQAKKLGAKMLDAAEKARDRAEEVAQEASVTLKDPTLRRGFWQSYKRPILFGAAALAILAGGGYGFGCYQAGKMARDAIDGFLIRNHLQQEVTYKDISATPFGRVTLSGVRLALPMVGQPLEIASLSIGGVDPKGGVPTRLEIGWSGLILPAGDFASGEELSALIGSGFQTLKGEGSFSWRFDPGPGELTVKTAGGFADAGNWDFEAALTNLNMATLGMGNSVWAPLQAAQLKSVDGSLDFSGLAKRTREIPRTNMPTDKEQPFFDTQPAQIGNSLVEAGMAPSDARDTADALQKFAQTGARITLKSRMDRPVPLFTAGGFLQPQVMNLPALLAATKISSSH